MPGPVTLTASQLRALGLVADGKVTRVYRSDRNAFRLIPGINANVFWSLLRLGLIRDGTSTPGVYATTCTMALTETGEHTLEQV